MLTVYYTKINKEKHERLMQKNLPYFSNDFKAKVNQFKFWQDAQLSLLGRLLLVKGLEDQGQVFDCSLLSKGPYNKPIYQDINFNISHSGEYAICAFSDSEVGVDIEKMSKFDYSEFEHQLSQKDWFKIMSATDKLRTFYDVWSQKEAVLKANGKGLGIPLKSFEINNSISSVEDQCYFIQALEVNDSYSSHVATLGKKEMVDLVSVDF